MFDLATIKDNPFLNFFTKKAKNQNARNCCGCITVEKEAPFFIDEVLDAFSSIKIKLTKRSEEILGKAIVHRELKGPVIIADLYFIFDEKQDPTIELQKFWNKELKKIGLAVTLYSIPRSS